MTRQEHLLIILGEECSELHQELCKALRFGVYEQRDLPTDNSERIFKEFNDLMAMVEMVNGSAVLTSFEDASVTLGERGLMYRDEALIRAKKEKVEKYLLYSKECGTLDARSSRVAPETGDSHEY
jgi:hypothetical protein